MKKDQEEVWNKQLRSHENRIREISDAMKSFNVRIIGIPEWEEKKRRLENIFEQILHENLTSLGNGTNLCFLEAERSPLKINKYRKTTRHLIVRLMNQNLRQQF